MIFWLNLFLLGISSALLTIATQKQLGSFEVAEYNVAFFNLFATICSYNVMRSRLIYLHPGEKPVEQSRIVMLTVIAIAAIGAAYFLISLSQLQILRIIPVVLFSAAYFLPIVKTQNGVKRLRDFYFIKHAVVGAMWGGATVFVVAEELSNYSTLLLFAERAFFIASLSLLFDHRDIDMDTFENHQTTVKLKGWKTSKRISLLLMFLAGVATLLIPKLGMATVSKITVISLTLILIQLTSKDHSAKWYNAVLESMILLFAIAGCVS